MNKHIELAIWALRRQIGDDSEGARSNAEEASPEELDVRPSADDETPREVLARYKSYDDNIRAAIAYLEGL